VRAAALGVLLLPLVACGGGGGDGRMTIYAAASLTEVFEELKPDARFNFGGSDELATQLREGAEADVYAAASPRYPAELHAEGLLEQPRVFATNRLVLIVPRDNPAGILSVDDLLSDGAKLVVGAEGVPVGDYTRTVLARLGRTRALEQVVSEEDDVKGVVGKVALGEADAGFVYATDVAPVAKDVRAIELPARAEASARYPIALVADGEHRDEAERFVDRLLGPEGRRALRAAGFGLP
jgi:molybdate transport system substrate-binding protein